MSYWLIYERCDQCEEESCLQCHRSDRSLTLRVVERDSPPKNSLDGPCAVPQEILQRMSEFFAFDENTGKMYFKVSDESE